MIPPVTFSGGVALLDYDRDGWLDDVPSRVGIPRRSSDSDQPGTVFFRNRGDGTASRRDRIFEGI